MVFKYLLDSYFEIVYGLKIILSLNKIIMKIYQLIFRYIFLLIPHAFNSFNIYYGPIKQEYYNILNIFESSMISYCGYSNGNYPIFFTPFYGVLHL